MNPRLVVPLACVLGALVLPVPAAHAAAQCQGKDATVVAAPDQPAVTGTDGPDVIVATAAGLIDARGGDDTICLAHGRVLAGDGNDSVLVTGTQYDTQAQLGPGDDTYVGGPGRDQVDLFAGESVGKDTLSTGAGSDDVGTGTGIADQPNHDVIDVGADTDHVTAFVAPGSDAVLTGGGQGHDSLNLAYADGTYVQDLAAGTVTSDGATLTTFTGFGQQVVRAAAAHVSVLGTPGNDVVYALGTTLDADLGAGDDLFELAFVTTAPVTTSAGAGSLVGGPGLDTVRAATDRSLKADLDRGTLGVRSAKGGAAGFTIDGFENFGGVTMRAKVTGDGGPNSLSVYGCRVTLRGGAGRDHLVLSADNEDSIKCAPSHARFFGGRGRDLLQGRRWDDVLVGGPGRDVANGGGGHDVCAAERIKGHGC